MAEERHCTGCGVELPADAPQGLCPQCLMKLGLPSGVEADKVGPSNTGSDVPTSATPPGKFEPPNPAELAKQFPQLDVLELLGQGGMGAVYKARQKQLDRLVALKILSPQVGQDPAFAERFAREARSLAKLNHPYIVTVYDFGQTENGLFYFVMEFVEGTDLRHVIQAGELSPREALAIVPQICQALQYAHDEGIVHRDIKPENILLDKKGRVKIADFGLAKLLDRPAEVYTLTGAGQKMGTPHYMAPEQVEHPHQVDHRADIYSLGVVFYEMLTGELPLGRFSPPSKKVRVDVRLDEVVLKTLEKEPDRRYQHASEVRTDVETIGSDKRADDDIKFIRRRVWIPAIGLLIAGMINFVGPFECFRFGSIVTEITIVLLMVVQTAVVIIGAWNLMQLRSYRLALLGSFLGILPFAPSAIVGIPMGIWALILLNRSEVQEAFASRKKEQVRRYQHASEVKTDVEAISSGGQIATAASSTQPSRMEKHITLVAAISIVFGTLGILIGIFLFVAISGGGFISGDPEAMSITGIVGTALGGFVALTSVPGVIAGIGLLKRRSWARILAIILAILDLIEIPIGTAIGIYALWVLLNDETAKLFARASAKRKKEEAA